MEFYVYINQRPYMYKYTRILSNGTWSKHAYFALKGMHMLSASLVPSFVEMESRKIK